MSASLPNTNPEGFPSTSSGGGGSGTVTSITAGTGLSGGTITTSGTIALANTVVTAGSYTSANITVNAQGQITAAANGSGGGGVSSFTGDGTILSNSASTGAVTATLANAAAYTQLGNNTSSSAAPTYIFGNIGYQAITATSGTVNLTTASPSLNLCNGVLTGSVTINLPQASTCPNKVFTFIHSVSSGSYSHVITAYSGDNINGSSSVSLYGGSASGQQTLVIASSGGTQWVASYPAVLGLGVGGTGAALFNSGAIGVVYQNNSSMASTAASTAGQLLQGNAASAPTWTSTPGSGTALTSITAVHQIAGGTAPTVAVGAGAGTGGSPGATITGHDTDFAVTLTMGTTTATGVIFTVTFGTAYGTAPYVVITPGNANAAAVSGTQGVYATSGTTTIVLNSGTVGLTAA